MSSAPNRGKDRDGPIQFAPRRLREQSLSLVDDMGRLDDAIRPAAARRPAVNPNQIVELERDVFDALQNAGQRRFGNGVSADLARSSWLRKAVALAIGGAALAAVLWTAWPVIEGAASLVAGGQHTATAAVDTRPMPPPPQQQGGSANPPPLGIDATPPAPDAMRARGTEQPTATAPQPSPAPTIQQRIAAPTPAKETRRIAPDELAVLIRRGEEILKTGDLAAARLLLERAAEAGSARAAFLIGTSYDAASPGRRPADAQTARSWFERAADLGSPEAQQRLGASAAAAPQ
jgi:hypothetical protein